jgi:hypothetical protein
LLDLRCQIDKNDFKLHDDIKDPNIPGSLLKLWLRELSEPLIPNMFYDACVEIGKGEITKPANEVLKEAKEIIASIPGNIYNNIEINQKVVKYMIAFLQEVAKQENQTITKMTPANIAMVFAPNFLRCPVDDLSTIFQNQKYHVLKF